MSTEIPVTQKLLEPITEQEFKKLTDDEKWEFYQDLVAEKKFIYTQLYNLNDRNVYLENEVIESRHKNDILFKQLDKYLEVDEYLVRAINKIINEDEILIEKYQELDEHNIKLEEELNLLKKDIIEKDKQLESWNRVF